MSRMKYHSLIFARFILIIDLLFFLHFSQLASMMERLTDWCKDVSSMQNLLQEQASAILTL